MPKNPNLDLKTSTPVEVEAEKYNSDGRSNRKKDNRFDVKTEALDF